MLHPIEHWAACEPTQAFWSRNIWALQLSSGRSTSPVQYACDIPYAHPVLREIASELLQGMLAAFRNLRVGFSPMQKSRGLRSSCFRPHMLGCQAAYTKIQSTIGCPNGMGMHCHIFVPCATLIATCVPVTLCDRVVFARGCRFPLRMASLFVCEGDCIIFVCFGFRSGRLFLCVAIPFTYVEGVVSANFVACNLYGGAIISPVASMARQTAQTSARTFGFRPNVSRTRHAHLRDDVAHCLSHTAIVTLSGRPDVRNSCHMFVTWAQAQ